MTDKPIFVGVHPEYHAAKMWKYRQNWHAQELKLFIHYKIWQAKSVSLFPRFAGANKERENMTKQRISSNVSSELATQVKGTAKKAGLSVSAFIEKAVEGLLGRSCLLVETYNFLQSWSRRTIVSMN